MRVVMTDRAKERFVIEMDKPFNLSRHVGAKYILLNINRLNIRPHRIECGYDIQRFIRSNLIDNIMEEENIPQSIKDKLKELGITE